MITKNNWLSSNFIERIEDPTTKLEISYNLYNFSDISFNEACTNAANEIKNMNRPIYISFSGGMDSEYIVRLFKSLNITFVPIIVRSSGNIPEYTLATQVCNELNITPLYLDMTDVLYIRLHKKYINDKLGLKAPGTVPLLLIQEYVNSLNNNGLVITGEHVITGFYLDGKEVNVFPAFFDYYFYSYLVDESVNYIVFFLYSPDIVYSTLKTMNNYDNQQDFKADLYQIPHRKKMSFSFSTKVNRVFDYLNPVKYDKTLSRKLYGIKELSDILEPWKLS